MIIRPYSDTTAFASGGPLEPTAANFPACKHFWKCNEATVNTSLVARMTDSIGNVVFHSEIAYGLTNNNDGTVSINGAIDTLDSGTLASCGSKNVLVMFGGKPSATLNNLTFGSISAGPGFRSIGTAAGTPAAWGTGGAGLITGTAGLAGNGSQFQSRALAITWNNATGLAPSDWDGTTYTERAAAGNLTGHTGITTMNQTIDIGGSARPAYIQIWHFTTLPSALEIKAALLWTHAMASVTPYGKYLYPGFKGRT